MICATCNLHYPDHLNYCRRCGNPLIDSTDQPAIEALCCTRCGARFVAGENFCQQCGYRLSQRSQETVVGGCYGCGTPWRSGWLYCRKCGLDRDQALMGPLAASAGGVLPVKPHRTSAAVEEVDDEEIEGEPLRRVPCPACEVAIKPYSRFCEACGASISPYSRPMSTLLPADDGPGESSLAEAVKTDAPLPIDHLETTPPLTATSRVASLASPTSLESPASDLRPELETPDGEELFSASARSSSDMNSPRGAESGSLPNGNAPRPGFVIPVGAPPARGSRKRPGENTRPEGPEKRKESGNAAWQAFGVVSVVIIILGLLFSWWMTGQSAEQNGVTRLAPDGAERPDKAGVGTSAGPAPEGMVFVPGGLLQRGRADGDRYEGPVRAIRVEPFFMDRVEVTNESYQEYVRATGIAPPAHWVNGMYPDGQSQLPVVNVSWYDAKGFAEWAGKRLPSEVEWEYAARGGDGRLYPWGNEWKSGGTIMANAGDGATGRIVKVGSYPKGESPFGVLDLSGNVWEWTSDKLLSYADGSTALAAGRVIRGGAYDVAPQQATATYRGILPAEKGFDKTGFRCVRDPR